jgi:hypothetical protein
MYKRYTRRTACLLNALLVVLFTACASAGQGSSQAGGPSLVGMWSGNCSFLSGISSRTEFRDDGTATLNDLVGKYSVNGDRVQISVSGYTFEYSYLFSQSGNLLKMSDANGHFCVVGRQGSDAVGELRQALIGTWTLSGQPCQSLMMYYLSAVKQLDFKTNQTVDATTSQGLDTYVYILQEPGIVVFRDNIGNKEPYSAWISDTTMTLENNPGSGLGGGLCSFQKSA